MQPLAVGQELREQEQEEPPQKEEEERQQQQEPAAVGRPAANAAAAAKGGDRHQHRRRSCGLSSCRGRRRTRPRPREAERNQDGPEFRHHWRRQMEYRRRPPWPASASATRRAWPSDPSWPGRHCRQGWRCGGRWHRGDHRLRRRPLFFRSFRQYGIFSLLPIFQLFRRLLFFGRESAILPLPTNSYTRAQTKSASCLSNDKHQYRY